MFLDLSGIRSVRWSHAAARKNVLGPIQALPQPSAAFCELKNVPGPIRDSLQLLSQRRCTPEECSWTYPGFLLAPGPILFTKRIEWGALDSFSEGEVSRPRTSARDSPRPCQGLRLKVG